MLEPNQEQRLRAVVAILGKCRAALINSGNLEAAQLVSLSMIEIRMKLNRISDEELKVGCDAMQRDDAPTKRPEVLKSVPGQRPHPRNAP